MIIFYRGSILSFIDGDPRTAIQQLALAMLSAVQQSYPERLK